MSFVKFLQGALEGATEAMPAAFERHDARKKFEQQIQMQRSQFSAEMGLKQKELDASNARNEILRTHNKAQQDLDREMHNAQVQGKDREFWTTLITGTVSEVELEALRARLPDIDSRLRGTYESLIESRLQQLAFKAEQRYEDLMTKTRLNSIDDRLRLDDTEGAILIANSLPEAGREMVLQYVKDSTSAGRIGEKDPLTEESELRYRLHRDAFQDWMTANPFYTGGVSRRVEEINSLTNQYWEIHNVRPPVVKPPPVDPGTMDPIIPTDDSLQPQFRPWKLGHK